MLLFKLIGILVIIGVIALALWLVLELNIQYYGVHT